LAAALYDEKQAHEAVRAAAEERDRQLEAGRRIRDSLRTAEEAYAAEIAELNTLLRAGAIDHPHHHRIAACRGVDGVDRDVRVVKQSVNRRGVCFHEEIRSWESALL
jgi:hypothetical protein